MLPLLSLGETDAEATVRDPFWPVGYAPAPEVTETPKEVVIPKPVLPSKPVEKPVPPPPKPVIDWKAARTGLKISGYAEAKGVRGCFVNGRLVREGQTVTLNHKGMRYEWRVLAVPEATKLVQKHVNPDGKLIDKNAALVPEVVE
ncbi:MAG: hypothetical protein ACOYD3_07190 [Kiritimatiellia bacterium]